MCKHEPAGDWPTHSILANGPCKELEIGVGCSLAISVDWSFRARGVFARPFFVGSRSVLVLVVLRSRWFRLLFFVGARSACVFLVVRAQFFCCVCSADFIPAARFFLTWRRDFFTRGAVVFFKTCAVQPGAQSPPKKKRLRRQLNFRLPPIRGYLQCKR